MGLKKIADPFEGTEIETVPATKVRDRLGEMFERIRWNGERFLIEKRGKRVAAVVSTEDLERLVRLDARKASKK